MSLLTGTYCPLVGEFVGTFCPAEPMRLELVLKKHFSGKVTGVYFDADGGPCLLDGEASGSEENPVLELSQMFTRDQRVFRRPHLYRLSFFKNYLWWGTWRTDNSGLEQGGIILKASSWAKYRPPAELAEFIKSRPELKELAEVISEFVS